MNSNSKSTSIFNTPASNKINNCKINIKFFCNKKKIINYLLKSILSRWDSINNKSNLIQRKFFLQ